MALSFLDNVDYRGKKPNFTRDLFADIATMAAFNENYLPNVFMACNEEDGQPYVFNRNNTVDATFGKWRPIEGGTGGSTSWDTLIGKPFKDIDGNTFVVDENGVLSVAIPEVPIEKISVNGTEIEPTDKVVDIIVPTVSAEDGNQIEEKADGLYVPAYDDTALAEKITANEEAIAILNGTEEGSVVKTVDEAINKFATELSDDGVVNTFKELIDYAAAHTSEIGEIVRDVEQNTTDIGTLNTDVSTIKDDYLTSVDKTELTESIAENATAISDLDTKVTEGLDGKLDIQQSADEAGKILIVSDDGSITFTDPAASSGDSAENIAYVNADYSQYSNVDLALDALFAKVYYVKPTCSLSANPTGGTFEMGTVITAPIVFNWTTNKPITSQTLTGFTLENTEVRTATYETDISTDKTFTLSVSDGENNASSSVSYKFMNNVFWGSAAAADAYDSAFVDALSNKKLTNSVKGTYSFNVADGEYGFWAVPSNMTISTVWIGGFEVTVESVGTISYLNSKGYTRDYNLYKTGQSGLGSISAEIK